MEKSHGQELWARTCMVAANKELQIETLSIICGIEYGVAIVRGRRRNSQMLALGWDGRIFADSLWNAKANHKRALVSLHGTCPDR